MGTNLNLLLVGQFVSQMGDKIYILALAYWVVSTTHSPERMGFVLGTATISLTVCSLFSGTLADRWNRKSTIVVTDLLRALLIVAVGISMHAHVLTYSTVLLSQVALGALSSLFTPNIPAIIPQIVEEHQLYKANSRRQFISGCSTILGPVLGGILAASYGYEATIYANAGSFLFAAVLASFIRYEYVPTESHKRLWQDLKQGYAYLLKRNALLRVMAVVAVLHAFVGSMQVAVPLLAKAFPANYGSTLGLLQAAVGIGSVATAIILGFSVIDLRGRELTTLLLSISVVGITYVTLGLFLSHRSPVIWQYCILLVGLGGSVMIASSSFETYLQSEVSPSMAGRVFGVVGSVGSSTIALSTFCFGLIVERHSLAWTLILFGVLMSVATSLFLAGVRPAHKLADLSQ